MDILVQLNPSKPDYRYKTKCPV